ncbi:4-carboxymuconolactone decarboxylase [Pantoea rodasii]|uniref:4-carboxymuconolactone decarboxylase n=1 Tax=Pantoea rodasii TaxID=1076549 RepID=A0A2M9WD43_9GAMM|nr:carboxymuconolactone decarboxylase family protein [Pantoea rodasii]ORM60029.1 4-carboxymuconolactone decarboxylase [Pantoea rodasii]PJZ05473.1 4-carboxymuconolactone decarboxylase [Pantoea rodasii]
MKITELTSRQQAIAPISAFTAQGDLSKLKAVLELGLDAGLTINDIKEILVQLYAYLGFPRALNGLGTFMALVNERKEQGIEDIVGVEAGPLPADKSRLELGTAVQTYLIGVPVKGPVLDFAPAIDAYLKDHLFGDIFGRDNLGYKDREIATLGALAGLEGVEPQLMSHFNISLNIGLTETQLKEVIAALESSVSPDVAQRATSALDKVLATRK